MLNTKIERGQVEKLVVGKLKSADGKNFLVLDSLGNELLKLDLGGAVDKFDDNIILASRNIRNLVLISAEEINVLDLVSTDVVVATEEAIKNIEEVLK